MQSEAIEDLYNFIKVYHATQEVHPHELDENRLKCGLRKYQKDAVRWMMSKELRTQQTTITCQGLPVELPTGGILADEMGLGKTVEVLACILSNPCPSDSLVVRRPSLASPPEVAEAEAEALTKHQKSRQRKRKKAEAQENTEPKKSVSSASSKKGLASEKFAYLRAWYEESIGAQKPRPKRAPDLEVKCFCKTLPESNDRVVCQRCGTEQHRECVKASDDLVDYVCPWCWSKEEPVVSGATFIVCPFSIMSQWSDEISRHVNDSSINVLLYNGVKSRGYIQPCELASYDVVITTYETLRTELNYSSAADADSDASYSLRHSKKYFSPATPLTCVRWWRICLDEAQMVEGHATAAAQMTRKLSAVHRWAVTGTPIQKCPSDLFGLVDYLRIEPYSTRRHWNSLMEDKEEFENFVASIMWRNSKKDVFAMLGVPPQTVQAHWLSFSPIEVYFYKKMKDECTDGFTKCLIHVEDLSTPIRSLPRRDLDKLLIPLLKLRQACIHPQVVRGKFLKFKHTMKMEDLIVDMASKAKIDFANALRQLVTSLNGLAALSIINFDRLEAVRMYRKVLGLANEYKTICKVDTLQMIHTMHNLSIVLECPLHGAPPTLRDSQLKEEVQELESAYLKKISDLLSKTKQKQASVTDEIEKVTQENSGTLGYSDWWCRVINWSESEDLRTRIVTHLDNQRGATTSRPQNRSGERCKTINAKKLSSMPSIYHELSVWLAEADTWRIAALKGLAGLDKIETEALVNSAYQCHLKKPKAKKKSEICKLCIVEELLLKYEKTIFSIPENNRKRKKGRSEDGSSDEEGEIKFSSNNKNEKEIADLKEAEVLSLKREGNWSLTDHERILQILSNYAKMKKAPEGWVSESVKHLTLLELVRKEFKLLRDHWRHKNYVIDASNEIAMSKLRLRLPTEEELLQFDQLKKNRLEHIFIVFPHEVEIQWRTLEHDRLRASAELKKTHGIYLYLERLRVDGCGKDEPCPVCHEILTPPCKWSVLHCGHCICLDCFSAMVQLNPQSEVECPLCRVKTPKQCVSYAVKEEEDGETLTKGYGESMQSSEEAMKAAATAATLAEAGGRSKLSGSYSTKVEGVVRALLRLMNDDPEVKVLIFSAWIKVLDVISEALLANNILFRKMGTGKDGRIALQQFKSSPPITALLIPIHLGSKGLNIIEATHVFLVEPLLNPADELQAIGRVHRIGQTKPTFVHRFIIANTVEDKIVNTLTPQSVAGSSSMPDGASENDSIASSQQLTVQQLFSLFS